MKRFDLILLRAAVGILLFPALIGSVLNSFGLAVLFSRQLNTIMHRHQFYKVSLVVGALGIFYLAGIATVTAWQRYRKYKNYYPIP